MTGAVLIYWLDNFFLEKKRHLILVAMNSVGCIDGDVHTVPIRRHCLMLSKTRLHKVVEAWDHLLSTIQLVFSQHLFRFEI